MFTSRGVVAFLAFQSVVRTVIEVAILNKVTAEESERKLYEAINFFSEGKKLMNLQKHINPFLYNAFSFRPSNRPLIHDGYENMTRNYAVNAYGHRTVWFEILCLLILYFLKLFFMFHWPQHFNGVTI